MLKNSVDLNKLVNSSYSRVVAVEAGKDGYGLLYTRENDGIVKKEELEFLPWFLVAGDEVVADIPKVVKDIKLNGPGEFNHRLHFANFADYKDALKHLKITSGYSASSPDSPCRVYSDQTMQILTILPVRLFRGLNFAELQRMQIDIETYTTAGFDFSNAERELDRVIMIAMSDSTGWEKCLMLDADHDEKSILQEMVKLVQERDPDVIEGHNIFNFDLPYLETRCKRHRVAMKFGRDGSRISKRSSRTRFGERAINYKRYEAFGRHIIDTLHLVQLYDVSHRDLESYGLKYVAKYFGVASPERTYVAGEEISSLYDNDPELLRKYALDDVRETEAISRLLTPSYFYQSQLIPYSLQNCVVRGNATRIEALLVAEYQQADESVPRAESSSSYGGGLTAAFVSGVFDNVWHCDVQSLYPSIIVSKELHPKRDSLKIFNHFLRELRNFRLVAKDAARNGLAEERPHWEALQSTFKILINSFYGYCGFGQGSFNDYSLAGKVTETGREILTTMLTFLQENNATVIEMDTDGIYFVPPVGEDDPVAMQKKIQATLPQGIDVELDNTYKAMFGYKSKNYALLGHDNKMAITGAALKSRGLEPFQRDFIHELLSLLLNHKEDEASYLLRKYEKQLKSHELPLRSLSKRENLNDSPKSYADKRKTGKGRRSAAYELALAADRDYQSGDQIVYYVTGKTKSVVVADSAKLLVDADDQRDENVAYYLAKLRKLQQKFSAFIPDPDSLF